MKRIAACVLPISSARRELDWGIGDVTALEEAARYLLGAGIRAIQVLPPHALPDGETSPYGAESAFALDPMYVDPARIPELATGGAYAVLAEEVDGELLRLRASAACDFSAARRVKRRAFDVAFALFAALPEAHPRRQALEAFSAREASWLPAYAKYAEAYAYRHDGVRPSNLRARYEQYVVDEQWSAMRATLNALGVELWGDVPFIVSRASADVRFSPDDFLDVSLGVPPDAFASEGQDWGLPAYRLDTMAAHNFGFLRRRTERAAKLYDAFRIDHVVGYFRQWVWSAGTDGKKYGRFDIEGDVPQRERGRAVLSAMQSALGGSAMFAEDLGVIPPFVREVLADLSLAGYKIVPWEAAPKVCDPRSYPPNCLAAFGTHDTPSLLGFWDEMAPWIRDDLRALAGIDGGDDDRTVWRRLIALLAASPATRITVLIPDIFGSRERINTPGTVGPQNWTYRIPKTSAALAVDNAASWHCTQLRELLQATDRV